jgi:uncharacterized protein (TIGR04255 family)
MLPKKKETVRKATPSKKSAKTTRCDVSSRKYGSDYLKQVIVRVDFAREIIIPRRGPKVSFRNALSAFPIVSLESKPIKHIKIDESGVKETTEVIDEWTLQNEKADKKAVLSKSSLFYSYSSYPGFETLRSEFMGGFDALCKADPELVVGRFGLRYINQIEIDEDCPTDWDKWLVPELISSFRLADDVNTVSRAFNVLEFSYPDDTKMRFQYGMPNIDYPAVIKRKMFVLDYDAYVASSIEFQDVAKLLETFYLDRIKPAFEQVITDNLRKHMRSKK